MKLFLLSIFLVAISIQLIPLQEMIYDFTDTEINETLKLQNYKGHVVPKIENGYLNLMRGGWAKNHNNAVIFPDIINDKASMENYTFHIFITKGAEGAGFALVNVNDIISIEQSQNKKNRNKIINSTPDSLKFYAKSWENPNFIGSFGLGIDIYNPQSSHWFDEYGNFYGREEREISLHWDGREVHKILSPIEFRSDGMNYNVSKFDLIIEYIVAGALINVSVNDVTVVENYFIPEMLQYNKQPIIGASTSDLTCNVILTSFAYKTEGEAPLYNIQASQLLFENEIFHAGNRKTKKRITFPKNSQKSDKVILTIDLDGPPGGVADWDVTAAIYLIDKDSTQFEIVRYITPYRRAFVWKVDITHFLPLFTDSKTLIGRIDTWDEVKEDFAEQRGWKLTAKLDYYVVSSSWISIKKNQNNTVHKPFKVHNLWSGSFEYGDPNNPMKDMLNDFEINVPKNTKSGILRVTTSGHGMSPNTDNAAEFRPSDRTIIINGDEYFNTLWRTDCYLNPCRPQDGTWKFDRAGWAPGDIVHPWIIDLTDFIKNNKTLKFSYIPDDYINHNKGEQWPPHHFIEAQVIFYK